MQEPKTPSPCPHCGKASFKTGTARKQHIRDAHTSPSADTVFMREVGECARENKKRTRPLRNGDKDYDTPCTNCEETPTVHPTELCGPCCFGEAETYGGNW